MAFTLADGFAYVEECRRRGMDVDEFAPRLSFFFNAHIDFFEEIAKYRAARRIWARELRDRYGATGERSLLMRFHTQTAGVSLTAQQPEVNIVRTALEAMAAVLGGTQSLHTNSYDEALALPTEGAARLALRTQQVIAHETGVVNSADPLGGSWLVEALTNRLEREAYDYFERIDRLGGVIAALNENFFQREIAEASYRYQREVEDGRRLIVGVNAHTSESDDEVEILRISPDVERRQRDRLNAVRGRRDGAWCRRRSSSSPPTRPPTATSCRRWSSAPGRTRPRARSATRCGRCGASTGRRRSSERRVHLRRHRMRRMEIFEIDGVEAARSALSQQYHEFLRRDSMSAGLYVLRAREQDPQTPHGQDELYYVVSGRGRIRVHEHDRPVGPGSIVFVEAGVEHRFHTITSDLTVLVVFAPPEE